MDHSDVSHATSGWAPSAIVAVYVAVGQEERRVSGEPPLGAPLTSARADATGRATVTVPANVPLAMFGQRAYGRDGWVLTSAEPAWQKQPAYTVGGRF